MNKFFKGICWFLFIFINGLLIFPFLSIVKLGWKYLTTFPFEIEIQKALILSLKASIMSSFLCTVITLLMCNVLLYAPNKVKRWSQYLFNVPMGIPHLVTGVALLLFFGQNGIGEFLNSNFNIDFIYQESGVYLAMFFINIPYSMVTMQSNFNRIDTKMIFTARSLGANEFQSFIHVILPALKKEILALSLMNWSRAIGEFGVVMMVVGVTRMKTETLATSVFLNMSTGDTDVAVGLALILILISVVTVTIFRFIEKEKDDA